MSSYDLIDYGKVSSVNEKISKVTQFYVLTPPYGTDRAQNVDQNRAFAPGILGSHEMEINATILLQLALFLVLMVMLSQFLFQPLLRLFDARERRIDGAQEEAKQYRENADQKAAIIEERVHHARQEARETLNDFKARAKGREDEIIGAARELSQTRLSEAREVLEKQVEQAKSKLNNDAMSLAEDMAAKALGRAL